MNTSNARSFVILEVENKLIVKTIPEERTDSRLESYLDEVRFGPEATAVLERAMQDRQVVRLLRRALTTNFTKQFGAQGEQFVQYCFKQLSGLPAYGTVGAIQEAFNTSRMKFRRSGLHYNDFKLPYARMQFELASQYLYGHVLDVGANDNSIGESLLSLKSDIRDVTGIDIEKRGYPRTNSRLHFRVQPDTTKLPMPDSSADSIIIKHSLHHMTLNEQAGILKDCHRCLMSAGHIVIYEDTYSFKLDPLNDSDYLYKQALELGGTSRMRLLLASLDVWPQAYKQKQMPFPNTYRTIEGWQKLFRDLDYEVVETMFYGIPDEGFCAAPLGIFILRDSRTPE